MGMPHKISIDLEYQAGLWFVTSKQVPCLRTNGDSIPDALRAGAKAIEALAYVISVAHSNNQLPRPMFREE